MEVAWTIHNVGHGVSPLIVHVPHAGTWIPDPDRRGLLLDDRELEMIEVRRDLYQRELGGPLHKGHEQITDRLSSFLSAITSAGGT